MGGVYLPPSAYAMPDALADRLCTQGASVFETAVAGELATAQTAGDTQSAQFFKRMIDIAGGRSVMSINFAAVGNLVINARAMTGVANINLACVAHQ